MPPTAVLDLDSLLVRRVRMGDERAFEQIVERYRAPLVRYAERVLRTRSGQAEDVVQESLWRAHHALARDDREIALRAWLYGIVRNACVDAIRRRNAASDDLAELPLGLAARDDTFAVVARGEEVRAAFAALAALPERQRAVIEDNALSGVSHRAAGARLGISEGASKVLLSRARANLRRETAEMCAAA